MPNGMRALAVSLAVAGATTSVSLAEAQVPPDWKVRCNRPLGGNNDTETGKYLFLTNGLAHGAQGRTEFDFSASGSRTAVVYPTAAKDLMNPFSSPSLGIGYFGLVGSAPPHPTTLKVGHVSMGAIARGFKPITGNVMMKLVLDGKAFGPFPPKPESVASTGQYTVWLDTAESDGDSKPPLLRPADFAKLARAIQTVRQAEVVLVRDGTDIVRMPVAVTRMAAWRDALPAWAAQTRARVTDRTVCLAGDRTVN